MGKTRVKEIKGFIKALEVVGAETILLDADDLLTVLDRLLKLERREAKRKAKKAAEIGVGDRVALTRTLDTDLWPYVIEGTEGTVKRIDTGGSYNVRVVLDNANGHPLSFQRSELRKITRGK